MPDKDLIRIANAGGYWGDDPWALRRQVLGPLPLDFISIDYLAEVTMSILQKQKARDPHDGYARDFISQMEPLLGEVLDRGIRIVTNAGGVNPAACAEALAAVARRQGRSLRIALVEGDDITPRMGALMESGESFRNLETGEAFAPHAPRLLSANAYFGALPVAEALKEDPQVVICGRVTDTGITLGPLIHAFGWDLSDWDRLASGLAAGHLLECGAQATGGNFTDWRKVPSFMELGFPVAEVREDGTFTLTKQPGTGGLVTCQTVREQFLYEMGDPRSYLSPDVIADFSAIRLRPDGPDRVRVEGVKGRPPTNRLKVSIACAEGHKASGALILSGPDARAKADAFAGIFWERCQSELARQHCAPLETTFTECVGHDATHRHLTPEGTPSEILLRLAAASPRRESLEVFRKLLPSMILSGPPGVAVTGGAPVLSEVVSYWPALMAQEGAPPSIRMLQVQPGGRLEGAPPRPLSWLRTGGGAPPSGELQDPWPPFPEEGPFLRVPLMRIAHARSGDKGDTVNLGLIGRSGPCYAWMRDHLPAEQIKAWFAAHCRGEATRHLVPGLWALNVLLGQCLGGGGTRCLAVDAQGKTLAQALLRCEVTVPAALLETILPEDRPCPGELVPDPGRP